MKAIVLFLIDSKKIGKYSLECLLKSSEFYSYCFQLNNVIQIKSTGL